MARFALASACLAMAVAIPAARAENADPRGFVGGARCATCHAEETRRWTGSHHDLAMQDATDRTVLGRFDGTTLTHGGVTTTFLRRDGKYVIRTDGPDGAPHDYQVAFTFGVDPLQQYLIPLPGGRLQATNVAWDTRPAARGGQRWFHLYPNEAVPHDDPLHWTMPSQNWNDRCARCHSTGLRKGYAAADDRYTTTWTDVDVSCEACHGPGARHVTWAERPEPRGDADAKGLTVRLPEREHGTWTFSGDSAIARRAPPRTSHVELNVCAPCHSRRTDFTDDVPTGGPLLDAYRPALLDEGLYFADGQIEDEVYEWGSFLQSRMFHAGVTCSNCHEPHGLGLRTPGNGVCAQCHLPTRFDTPAHHFHPTGSPGAACVACHMPQRTYMLVDERHDHGFRVPRPARSAAVGAPDVCTSCHRDRTPAWAEKAIAEHLQSPTPATPHWGEALAAGRRGARDADAQLVALSRDEAAPEIVRATAVRLLGGRPGPDAFAALADAAADTAPPLVRFAGTDALDGHEPRLLAPAAAHRLDDALGTIRVTAAQVLAGEPGALLTPAGQAALARDIEAYRTLLHANEDRPETYLDLALLDAKLGKPTEAEAALRTAIRRWPYFRPAAVNLADLLRGQARDSEGEAVLRAAVRRAPDDAHAHHALGLLLIRQGRVPAALPELERAATLAPSEARYAYVLGIALNGAGQTDRALEVLRAAHETRPNDPALLLALATINRDAGRLDEARRWAALLAETTPWDAGARRFRDELAAP